MAGMVLEADGVRDTRAIWEWLLEPLLATQKQWQVPSGSRVNTRPGGESAHSAFFNNGDQMQELTIEQTEEGAGGLAPVAAGTSGGAALGGYSARP